MNKPIKEEYNNYCDSCGYWQESFTTPKRTPTCKVCGSKIDFKDDIISTSKKHLL